MLDEKYITIGRLNQLCALDEPADWKLFAALWPEDVHPYLLWQKVFHTVWQKYVLHLSTFHLKTVNIEFPEIAAKADTFYEQYKEGIIQIFSQLSAYLFTEDFAIGLNVITDNAYGSGIVIHKTALDDYLSNLHSIEGSYNIARQSPFIWRTNITPSRYNGLLEEKKQFIRHYDFHRLHGLFRDVILVDKKSCYAFLSSHGYSLPETLYQDVQSAKEVESSLQGSSKNVAVPPAETIAIVSEPENVSLDKPVIAVPQELWAGKSGEAARDALREAQFNDAVIAYVLKHNAKLNKTRIGKLLSDHEISDSAYRDLTNRLLVEASKIDIKKL